MRLYLRKLSFRRVHPDAHIKINQERLNSDAIAQEFLQTIRMSHCEPDLFLCNHRSKELSPARHSLSHHPPGNGSRRILRRCVAPSARGTGYRSSASRYRSAGTLPALVPRDGSEVFPPSRPELEQLRSKMARQRSSGPTRTVLGKEQTKYFRRYSI